MNYFGKVFTAAALLVSCSQNMFAQHAPAAEQPSTAPAAESAPDFPEDAPMMQGSSEPRLYYIRKINIHGVQYLNADMLKSDLSAFAADTGSIGKDELLKVFCFFKNIEHYAPCFIITSEPSAFDEFGFVHCCRREWEFEELLQKYFGHRTASYTKKPSLWTGSQSGLERTVSEIIQKMGVPPNVKGYRYLRSAVMLATEDMTVLDSITKRLYPTVAQTNQTTPTRVERAIRHAITTAWDRQNGDSKFIEDKLHCKISFDGDKPTNSELIALISDCLRLSEYKV